MKGWSPLGALCKSVTGCSAPWGLLALPKTLAQPTQFLFQDVEPFSGVRTNDQTSTTVNAGLWTSNTHKDGPVLSL